MGSKLAINREEVRATYLATGSLKEAARLHGVKEATVRQWAKRDFWETSTNAQKLVNKAREIQEIKREKGHYDAVPVCHSSDALSRSLEENGKAFHSAMGIGLTKAASCLTELDGLSALEASRKMVDLANAGKTIFGIGQEKEGAMLSVNVLQLGLDALSIVKPA
jgi:transposase-like protein